jgi:Mn2+/Fe2+ NRAMP family transporter
MKHLTKKILVIFIIALVHLGVSRTVVAIALAGTSGNAFNGEMSMWVKMLIWITKVLYFPIISLSLYSRQWFPGKLIYIPIFTNSLLWAAVIYFTVRCFSKVLKP